MLLRQVIMVAVLCGCRGDLAFIVTRQSFLFSLTFRKIIEDFPSLGSDLRPFFSGEIALCVSYINTIEKFLTILSLCLSYIAATNSGLPTTTMCMRSWLTIREDLRDICTEVSRSIIEVRTVAVATDLDTSSELSFICIYMLQKNLNLFPVALRLVVPPKGVKCVFNMSFVSLKEESGLIFVKVQIKIGM